MGRERQRRKERREKRKLLKAFMEGKTVVKKDRKPWLNSEGYHDPTAYLAIRNT